MLPTQTNLLCGISWFLNWIIAGAHVNISKMVFTWIILTRSETAFQRSATEDVHSVRCVKQSNISRRECLV